MVIAIADGGPSSDADAKDDDSVADDDADDADDDTADCASR